MNKDQVGRADESNVGQAMQTRGGEGMGLFANNLEPKIHEVQERKDSRE